MASARKKQDEKNLKLLRDLASLPHNKYCFDCNQRGPTYVNVTIGSFVCTKCSGMLRGLTPPHRVKSISMASFTTEEVELLRSRGNNYCRNTWLGLYEGNSIKEREEQDVHDFMINKYELKRYFLENPLPVTNGISSTVTQTTNKPQDVIKLKNNFVAQPKLPQVNGLISEKNNKNINGQMFDFVADFGSADIYNAANIQKDTKINNNSDTQIAFANFDNQIFNNNSASMFNTITSSAATITSNNVMTTNGPPAPTEDRYAALKDLDNAFKGHTQLDWSSTSNGSFGSTTPSSMYSSPSPQSTIFSSPSQDHFLSQFGQPDPPKVLNPFNGNMWSDAPTQQTNLTGNPFRTSNAKTNGISSGFYASPFPVNNGNVWTPNPFMMGSSTSSEHSSNPFL